MQIRPNPREQTSHAESNASNLLPNVVPPGRGRGQLITAVIHIPGKASSCCCRFAGAPPYGSMSSLVCSDCANDAAAGLPVILPAPGAWAETQACGEANEHSHHSTPWYFVEGQLQRDGEMGNEVARLAQWARIPDRPPPSKSGRRAQSKPGGFNSYFNQ